MNTAAATIRAVLFDLDGTLVHTAPDIGAALNSALQEQGLQAVSPAQVIDFIGRGGRVLVQRAMAAQDRHEPELIDALFAGYVAHYRTQHATLASARSGAVQCLRDLAERGYRLAVVTNALQRFAESILQHYGLAAHLQRIVGADRVLRGKPDPESLWLACRELDVQPAEALMVGDSIHDIEAARAAGCKVLGITGGYAGERPLTSADCDLIDTLTELPDWLERHPA